jgi:hypothetical protein
MESLSTPEYSINENISTTIEPVLPKKKRVRSKKADLILKSQEHDIIINEIIQTEVKIVDNNKSEDLDIISKKRGRKPKGGKLISKNIEGDNNHKSVANIILHLKCSSGDLVECTEEFNTHISSDIMYNPAVPPEIKTYNTSQGEMFYSYTKKESTTEPVNNSKEGGDISNECDFAYKCISNTSPIYCSKCSDTINIEGDCNISNTVITDNIVNDTTYLSDIYRKLKQLKINLYKNNMTDKKSACFWCTYEFDTPECYIPTSEIENTIYGYGSFCRPECAVAYLMKETLDDSVKFDRYNLVNRVYGKIYNYKKNIKPAPDPHYMLEKFYGNLSIQEYRKLLKTDHLFLVIDKPLTRVLPELHEDIDDFTQSIYGNNVVTRLPKPSPGAEHSTYKVKQNTGKHSGPNKGDILRDQFGV